MASGNGLTLIRRQTETIDSIADREALHIAKPPMIGDDDQHIGKSATPHFEWGGEGESTDKRTSEPSQRTDKVNRTANSGNPPLC